MTSTFRPQASRCCSETTRLSVAGCQLPVASCQLSVSHARFDRLVADMQTSAEVAEAERRRHSSNKVSLQNADKWYITTNRVKETGPAASIAASLPTGPRGSFEGEIENRLGSAAILTAMTCTLGHERVKRVHGASSWMSARARSVAARTSQSISSSNSRKGDTSNHHAGQCGR